jgi:hypothetical protein
MNDDRLVQFVARLVQLTKEGHLEWRAVPQTEKHGVGEAFRADVEGKTLQIRRFEYEANNPEYDSWRLFGRSIGKALGGSDEPPPKTIIRSGVDMAVVGSRGQAIYKFPPVTGLTDLYDSAAYAAAGVDKLISSVLSDASTKE